MLERQSGKGASSSLDTLSSLSLDPSRCVSRYIEEASHREFKRLYIDRLKTKANGTRLKIFAVIETLGAIPEALDDLAILFPQTQINTELVSLYCC